MKLLKNKNTNIISYRQAKGMSQRELAEAAKVKYSTIKQLESGNLLLEFMPITTGLKIAQALDVTVKELVGDESRE